MATNSLTDKCLSREKKLLSLSLQKSEKTNSLVTEKKKPYVVEYHTELIVNNFLEHDYALQMNCELDQYMSTLEPEAGTVLQNVVDENLVIVELESAKNLENVPVQIIAGISDNWQHLSDDILNFDHELGDENSFQNDIIVTSVMMTTISQVRNLMKSNQK